MEAFSVIALIMSKLEPKEFTQALFKDMTEECNTHMAKIQCMWWLLGKRCFYCPRNNGIFKSGISKEWIMILDHRTTREMQKKKWLQFSSLSEWSKTIQRTGRPSGTQPLWERGVLAFFYCQQFSNELLTITDVLTLQTAGVLKNSPCGQASNFNWLLPAFAVLTTESKPAFTFLLVVVVI